MKTIIMTLLVVMLISQKTFCPPEKEKINQVKNTEFKFKFDIKTEKTALAIKHTESRGNYKIIGLSGEYGAYQFLPKTWNKLVRKYYPAIKDMYFFEDTIVIDYSPEWQDLIARFRIQELYKQGYSLSEVAAIWNSGTSKNWWKKVGTNSKGQKYNVPGYVRIVITAYNKV